MLRDPKQRQTYWTIIVLVVFKTSAHFVIAVLETLM